MDEGEPDRVLNIDFRLPGVQTRHQPDPPLPRWRPCEPWQPEERLSLSRWDWTTEDRARDRLLRQRLAEFWRDPSGAPRRTLADRLRACFRGD